MSVCLCACVRVCTFAHVHASACRANRRLRVRWLSWNQVCTHARMQHTLARTRHRRRRRRACTHAHAHMFVRNTHASREQRPILVWGRGWYGVRGLVWYRGLVWVRGLVRSSVSSCSVISYGTKPMIVRGSVRLGIGSVEHKPTASGMPGSSMPGFMFNGQGQRPTWRA